MTQNDLSAELRGIANASGFLMQLRIEDEVRSTTTEHGWDVIAREHPWVDTQGQEGFIDLILGKGLVRMVVECKRPREGNWVFLVPANPKGLQGTRLSYLCTQRMGDEIPAQSRTRASWRPAFDNLESYIADFCTVRGSGESQKPMLERIGALLTNSVDALAAEELVHLANLDHRGEYFYVPVIITTADLYVCRFRFDEISLAKGTLSEDKGEFEPVKYIRFRHTLTPELPNDIHITSISQANKLRERTLLVVRADALISVLKQWPSQPSVK